MQGPSVVILRLAAVYGRRVKGTTIALSEVFSRAFRSHRLGINRRTLVHEHDVTRAAILAARTLRRDVSIT